MASRCHQYPWCPAVDLPWGLVRPKSRSLSRSSLLVPQRDGDVEEAGETVRPAIPSPPPVGAGVGVVEGGRTPRRHHRPSSPPRTVSPLAAGGGNQRPHDSASAPTDSAAACSRRGPGRVRICRVVHRHPPTPRAPNPPACRTPGAPTVSSCGAREPVRDAREPRAERAWFLGTEGDSAGAAEHPAVRGAGAKPPGWGAGEATPGGGWQG